MKKVKIQSIQQFFLIVRVGPSHIVLGPICVCSRVQIFFKRYWRSQVPKGVTKAAQYGNSIKAHAVYMSQFQLLPYSRIQDYFSNQLQVSISEGSIFNFSKEAFGLLADFEIKAEDELAKAKVAHADETSINIGGKRHWLHGLSNEQWTHYSPHKLRGMEAMSEIGILPRFKGVLCHDHWKPYYRLECTTVFATHTLSENCKGPGNKTVKIGQKR